MELIAVRRAAVMFYFQVERLNPLRHPVRPVAEALVSRYGFSRHPQSADSYADADEGVLFGGGIWNDVYVEEFRLLSNGIFVATGESTDRAEQFFADAMQVWPENGLAFSPDLVKQRMYTSQLVVRSEVDLVSLNENIEGLVATTFGGIATGPASVGFFLGYVSSNPEIRIERLVGISTEEMQFWAQAPIPTSHHLDFLRRYEQALRR